MKQVDCIPENESPSVSVYAFSPTKAETNSKTGVTDLSDRGQAAWIEALTKNPSNSDLLRKAIMASTEADTSGSIDRTRLSRTLVISVNKGPATQPGDRLMRTVVTISPHKAAGEKNVPFEFSGYSVVATDTKIQNIAHLETTSSAKLSATLAPKIGDFGTNNVGGELSQSHSTSADISQAYENLGVDILPTKMSITRESERGLDVVGNTLIALTLATPLESERNHTAYLAGALKLYDEKSSPLPEARANMAVQPFAYIAQCDLQADVTLSYQLRRITAGREYYSEGKQSVQIVTITGAPTTQTLIRAIEAQRPLYQILTQDNSAVLATRPGSGTRLLLFDSYDDAKRMASWLSLATRSAVGKNGAALSLGNAALPAGMSYRAEYYSVGCPGAENPS